MLVGVAAERFVRHRDDFLGLALILAARPLVAGGLPLPPGRTPLLMRACRPPRIIGGNVGRRPPLDVELEQIRRRHTGSPDAAPHDRCACGT
jgi:hypothetical protein